MDLLDWLWNSRQDRDITDANTAINRTREQQEVAHDRSEARIDALLMVNAALWEIVRERLNMSDADLMAKIREIDLRDRIVDGRPALPKRTCARCSRQTAGRRLTCLYCGEQLGPKGPFTSAL